VSCARGRLVNEVHAHEVHAYEVHAYEVYGHEVYAREVHAHEVHARDMHAHEVYACEMIVLGLHRHRRYRRFLPTRVWLVRVGTLPERQVSPHDPCNLAPALFVFAA